MMVEYMQTTDGKPDVVTSSMMVESMQTTDGKPVTQRYMDEDQHGSSNPTLYQAIVGVAAGIITLMTVTIVVLSIKCHKWRNVAHRKAPNNDVRMVDNKYQEEGGEYYDDLSSNTNGAYKN